MIPLHFGTRARLLFGVYSPAIGESRRRGVVICNPWGVEAMRAHRSLRILADTLARNGFDVLRFDYYGTGDSWGEGREVTIRGFIEDVLEGARELEALAGVEKVDFVGLRLGAYVASAASSARGGGGNIVLWDPVTRGSDFLDELLADRNQVNAEDVEVGGFPLPRTFLQELLEISLESLPDLRSRVLLALSDPSGEADAKQFSGSELTVEIVNSPPCWVEERDFGAGVVPADLIRKIVTWL